MAIISINGKAGSGKDTVGAIINYLTCCNSFWRHKKELPKEFTFELFNSSDYTGVLGRGDFQIKKYSDKLKDMVCILIGCTREQLEDQDFKATPLSGEWKGYQISWDCKPTEWERSFKTEDEAIKYLNDHGAETNIEHAYKDNLIRKLQLTPRDILQKLGTDFGRDMLHPDIWINALFADYHSGIKMSDYTESKWIITDSRFPNDVERVKSLGGICIRINRDFVKCGKCNKTGVLKDMTNTCKGSFVGHCNIGDLIPFNQLPVGTFHESETALDNYEGFDYVIDNNGTIEELIEKVKEILIKENIIK